MHGSNQAGCYEECLRDDGSTPCKAQVCARRTDQLPQASPCKTQRKFACSLLQVSCLQRLNAVRLSRTRRPYTESLVLRW